MYRFVRSICNHQNSRLPPFYFTQTTVKPVRESQLIRNIHIDHIVIILIYYIERTEVIFYVCFWYFFQKSHFLLIHSIFGAALVIMYNGFE